jgi:hypothetical protein
LQINCQAPPTSPAQLHKNLRSWPQLQGFHEATK